MRKNWDDGLAVTVLYRLMGLAPHGTPTTGNRAASALQRLLVKDLYPPCLNCGQTLTVKPVPGASLRDHAIDGRCTYQIGEYRTELMGHMSEVYGQDVRASDIVYWNFAGYMLSMFEGNALRPPLLKDYTRDLGVICSDVFADWAMQHPELFPRDTAQAAKVVTKLHVKHLLAEMYDIPNDFT